MIFRVADRHQRREGYVSFFVEGDYGSPHAEVAGALSMSSDQLVSYHGPWSADFSRTNSFVTDFRYEG